MKENNPKDFKAVEFQRERRNELSVLMHNSPVEFEKHLNEVRKKYSKKFKAKKKDVA